MPSAEYKGKPYSCRPVQRGVRISGTCSKRVIRFDKSVLVTRWHWGQTGVSDRPDMVSATASFVDAGRLAA